MMLSRVDAATETLRRDATRRKEAEERREAANLPKPHKSRAQAYLDGDAVSVPLSFEIARDCIRLEAENERLQQQVRDTTALLQAQKTAGVFDVGPYELEDSNHGE